MTADGQTASAGGVRRFSRRGAVFPPARTLAFVVAVAAVLSCLATYGALTGSGPFGVDTDKLALLVAVDFVLLFLLGGIIVRRLARLWAESRQRMAGSRLQTRLAAAFSLAAAGPAIVVGIASVLFFNIGVDAWFSERVRTALDNSMAVARAYLDEHSTNVQRHAGAMAFDISKIDPGNLEGNILNVALNAQARIRGFSEAVVFRRNGEVLGKSRLGFLLTVELAPQELLDRASPNAVILYESPNGDRVRALVALENAPDTYLVVGRTVDPNVINHSSKVAETVKEYRNLEGQRSIWQIVFVLFYAVAALLLVFVAIWFALHVAARIVKPVTELAAAAERVREGDLAVRVDDTPGGDELALLSNAFNRMTDRIEAQRQELVATNDKLDRRRRFTESVLSGVSAGVIGLDRDGRVELPNRRALELLGVRRETLVGEVLATAVPEFAGLLAQAAENPEESASDNIELSRGKHITNLLVRIGSVHGDDTAPRQPEAATGSSWVVTFDDVTPLLAAQRKAAWANVARRVAHEIKNPLTPIRLAAERLQRRYLPHVTDTPDIFRSCTQTIIRQVDDLTQMVDEFSSFARLPAPDIASEDAVDLVEKAVTLQEVGQSAITFERDYGEARPVIACDGRQIGRVLNNVLKNAIEAIEPVGENGGVPGRILVTVAEDGESCIVHVQDNGRGLPDVPPEKLLEPYETHGKKKGTGLGPSRSSGVSSTNMADISN